MKEQQQEPSKSYANNAKKIRDIIECEQYDKLLSYTEFDLPAMREDIGYKLMDIFSKPSDKVLRHIIDNISDINVDVKSRYRIIHYVCQIGSFDILKYCIEKGSDIDITQGTSTTPLSLAIKKGKREHVKYLIEKGCCLDIADCNGKLPIHHACSYSTLEIQKILHRPIFKMEQNT